MNLTAAMEHLRATTSTEHHQFIPDDISLLDEALIDSRALLGHRQLTDAYLLALAVSHDARLVTLDTRISPDAVHGANATHLIMI